MANPDAPRVGAAGAVGRSDGLRGITVVDLTRYLPGPYCTRVLADLGASVIKVEGPGGDPMRTLAWYDALNAGKRVLTLDLRDPSGLEALHGLLSWADVCVEGFRPSTARAIGVDGASLAARHQTLVHCSISGYGQAGPDAERAAHDLNYQAEAGLLGRPPRVPQMLAADLTGALHAVIRILAALVGRRRNGGTSAGASIDVSLAAAAASLAMFRPPSILGGEYACYNVYEAADGEWVALGALEAKFWAQFCARAGRPDWVPQQFDPDPARTRLLNEVRAFFRTRSRDDWVRHFAGLDCCLSMVRTGL